jgi:hypothetical protein
MTKTTLVVGMITAFFMGGCGDDATGDGGSGGGSSSASSGSSKASTSASGSTSTSTSGSASTSASGSGSTSASNSASSSSGGNGAEHCAQAIRCDAVQGYFCYEVTGPDPAFETACAEELGGNFAQGPCGPEYDTSACIFDCVEPSGWSLAIEIGQMQCEMDGGTYYAPP